MEELSIPEFKLIGLSLSTKTTNENGQSAIDCGNHWQAFEAGNYAERIHNKISHELFAVYHDYDGDHTAPYAYFIGCKVPLDAEPPEGMSSLLIAKADYVKITAKGLMPDCVADVWKFIWASDFERAYQADFEIYGDRSRDWKNAEVHIYLGVKK